MRDRLLHIHRLPGDSCIACGDVPSSDNDFLSDPGRWNTEKRTCSPAAIVSPDYVLTPRDRPRSSAIKGERKPPLKKVRDTR